MVETRAAIVLSLLLPMRAGALPVLLLLLACHVSSGETIGEWVGKGCPSPEREWTAKDYTAILGLLENGTLPLLTTKSEPGRTVFRRMSNPENLSFYADQGSPVGARLSDMLQLSDSSRRITLVYANAANRGEPVEAEVADLLVLQIAVGSSLIGLVEEFLPTIPRDETYATRMKGLDQMKGGLSTVIDGAIVSLTERNFYSDESVAKLCRGIRDHYPAFDSFLPETARIEFRRRIKDLLDTEKSAKVKDELASLLAAMNARPTGEPPAPEETPATSGGLP